jgi:ComF family protein
MVTNTADNGVRSLTQRVAKDLSLGFKNLFLPAFCRKCGVRILTEGNLYFCDDCWVTITPVADPKCPSCGRPHSVRVGFEEIYNFVCSECASRFAAQKLWVTSTHAAGIHDGVLRQAIHLLKFGRKRLMAKPLARFALERILGGIDARSYDFVTVVPLHRNRLRERGYNQSELIAEHVSEGFPNARFEGLLMRIKDTPNFSQLGKIERRDWIRKAFAPLPGLDIKHKRILLVDDVVTTGATTNECARILRRAGADRVDVLAVAVAKRLY